MNSDARGGAEEYLARLNRRLKPGWSGHLGPAGRIYYCNHGTQTASWLPPPENWEPGKLVLPFGWEIATDKEGKQYFINHLNKTTTYEDPRKEVVEEPPQPREVELYRDSDMGFGFVAGSEKPVIVRFVTEGGPSVDKLLPGDQILEINGEDVKKAPREHVIELVRSCKHAVVLTVCQPHSCNLTRKSALLSAAKKAKLKSNPSRVRFAEGVVINGSPLISPSSYSSESCIPFMPNVLKVFLENGQTKSFKYDSSTTIQDVLESLHLKLAIKCTRHFSLVVEHIKSLRRNKLTLLDPKESLARIAARPGAQHLRCLFRVAFVPRDAYDLLRDDPVSFEYLYTQCCNDVVQERFAPELKYDVALRLAALHIQQHAISNNIQGKLSIKNIERECGLDKFVPTSLVETMKRKELRKLLTYFLKMNQNLSAPGQRTLTALQAKLHYLKIISELPSYGAKCFTTNLRDSNMETVILVSPKFGISQIHGMRNSMPLTLADVEDLSAIYVCREDELSYRVDLRLKDSGEEENIVFSLEDRDAEELVLLLQGYYQLLTNKDLPVHQEKDRWVDDSAPPYHTQHKVHPAGWNYVNSTSDGERDSEHNVDLSLQPAYQPSPPKIITANGLVPNPGINGNVKRSDATSGMATAMVKGIIAVDKNMNAMPQGTPVIERKGISQSHGSPCTGRTEKRTIIVDNEPIRESPIRSAGRTPISDNNGEKCNSAFDFQSVVSMEMLEDGKSPRDEQQTEAQIVEAKNEEVIRRVAEMHHIVHSAEMYLTGEDSNVPPPELILGEQLPPLKAADSLLLLTHMGHEADLEAVRRLELGVDEPSGSDTDSMSTPTDSPSHRTENRRSMRPSSGLVGSSFGLHSPDNLPVALHKANLQELLHRLQGESRLPYSFAEGTLYLDPDIIDLTMIPPPITPDREGMDLPLAVSMPPTPFADRQSLEAELRALETHLQNDTQNLEETTGCSKRTVCFAGLPREVTMLTKPTTLHFPLLSPTSEDNHLGDFNGDKLPSPPPSPPQGWGSGDIDTFIASVAVPPPPAISTEEPLALPEPLPITELTTEDISAFIIPPPPPSSSIVDADSQMIARLQQAAEKVKEVVSHGSTLPRMSRPPNRFMLNLQQPRTIGLAAGKRHVLYLESPAGDSSGYETQSSSIISCSDIKDLPTNTQAESDLTVVSAYAAFDEYAARMVDGGVNDTASIISGGSSSASGSTEYGGTQGDTEDSTNEESSIVSVRHKLVPKAMRVGQQAYDKDDQATSSESDDATNAFLPSPLIPDEGLGGCTGIHLRKMAGLPRSVTSPQIARNVPLTEHELMMQCNQSVSSENLSGDVINETKGSPVKSMRGTSSKEKVGEDNVMSPRKAVGKNSDKIDDSSYTGTILRSPHKSPIKLAQKNAVKPPLPPSPSQDPSRRGIISKGPRPILSPPVGKKSGSNDGTSTMNVPKPILPKGTNRSPSSSPKKVTICEKPSQQPKVPSSSLHSNSPASPRDSSRSQRNANTKPSDSPRWDNDRVDSPLKDGKGYNFNGFDSFSDSLEIMSLSSESTGSETSELLKQEAPLQKAEEMVGALIAHLDDTLDKVAHGDRQTSSKEKLLAARDSLVAESRRFVTASKLFVKSATESEEKLVVHLGLCVTLLGRMLQVTEVLASNTASPLQTQNLALKVRDVASTYMQTTRAAANAAGKSMNDPSMHQLMQHATALAAVLTALMRTLRTFNP